MQRTFAMLILVCISTKMSYAQGDTCGNAIIIPLIDSSYSYTGTTVGFGDDYNSVDVCSSVFMTGNDFVFKYTPTISQVGRLKLENIDEVEDDRFGVFILDGCPDQPSSNCLYSSTTNDTGSIYVETVEFEANTEYYIVISSYGAFTQEYEFRLDIELTIGNICDNAEEILSLPDTIEGTTRLFGDDYNSLDACTSVFMTGNDYVFRYFSPTYQVARFKLEKTDTLGNNRIGFFILDGCPDAIGTQCLSEASTNSQGPLYTQTFEFLANTEYYIVVSSYGDFTQAYDFSLSIDLPIGNICENAEQITSLPTSIEGTTRLFGDDYNSLDSCKSVFMTGNDYVFKYFSASYQVARLKLENIDTVNKDRFGFFVLDGCPDGVGSQCLNMASTNGIGPIYIETMELLANTEYFIVISSYGIFNQAYDFRLTIDLPIGNICSNAEVINSLPATFSGTTKLFGNDYKSQDSCMNIFISGNDYVYEYTPSMYQVARLKLTNLDTVNTSRHSMFILDGCPDAPGASCLYTRSTNTMDSIYLETVEFFPGQTYYIIISSYNAFNKAYDYALEIDLPIGNICENAHLIDSFPFNHTSSTYPFGNDYNSMNTCTSIFMSGRDYVFRYDALDNEFIKITLKNLNDDRFGLFLIEGCPDDPSSTCIASSSTNGNTDRIIETTNCLEAKTYYIIASSYNSFTTFYDFELIVEKLQVSIAGVENSGNLSDSTICFLDTGDSTLQLTALASGGNVLGDYQYLWNNPGDSTIATIIEKPLISYLYEVTVTDDNGCTAKTSYDLNINTPVQPSITVNETSGTIDDSVLCNDIDIVSLLAGPMGGIAPYTYSWSSGEHVSGINKTVHATTDFIISITDSKGCLEKDSVTILRNPDLITTAIVYEDQSLTIPISYICHENQGLQTIYIAANVSGGTVTSDYSYSWSTGESTQTITDTPASDFTYIVSVQDDYGCPDMANTQVFINNEIVNQFIIDESSAIDGDGVLCLRDAGTEIVTVTSNASGGTGDLSYNWDDPGNSMADSIQVTPLVTTNYDVTVTDDNNGCTNSFEQIITIANRINTWIGPDLGQWNSNPMNWSLGTIPTDCDEVIIHGGKTVTLVGGTIGNAYTIHVFDNGQLIVEPTAILNVVAPD